MNLFKELVKSSKSLTEKLLEEVSDYDIYCELAEIDFEIGRPIRSPIRDDDTRASFSLFIPTRKQNVRPEELWWRDFAKGSGNVFKFVQLLAEENYGITLNTRKEIIQFIDAQLNLGLFNKSVKKTRIKRYVNYDLLKKSKEILFKSRSFTRMDLFWWIKYGIDEPTLNLHNVRSIKYILNEDLTIKYKYGTYELAFAYVVFDKVKIYCPHDITFKWRNTCPSNYVLGIEQCTRKDILIITKSLKDIMVFKSFMNVDAISPQAESLHFSDLLVRKLETRYTHIFVVMDFDEAGIGAAEELENYGFTVRWVSKKQSLIDDKLKVLDKDISDYVSNHGIIEGMKHMKNMFPELSPSIFRDNRIKYLLLLKDKLSN